MTGWLRRWLGRISAAAAVTTAAVVVYVATQPETIRWTDPNQGDGTNRVAEFQVRPQHHSWWTDVGRVAQPVSQSIYSHTFDQVPEWPGCLEWRAKYHDTATGLSSPFWSDPVVESGCLNPAPERIVAAPEPRAIALWFGLFALACLGARRSRVRGRRCLEVGIAGSSKRQDGAGPVFPMGGRPGPRHLAGRSESDTWGTCSSCKRATKFAEMTVCPHGWRCRNCRCGECAVAAVKERAAKARKIEERRRGAEERRMDWLYE